MSMGNEYSAISKKVAIKQLRKVKLVIGNGFDLHCGMHSSYAHYFNEFAKNTNGTIDRWAEGFVDLDAYLNSGYYWYGMENIDSINVWDCFFCLRVKKDVENKNWCDIEEEIGNSLQGNKNYWMDVFYVGKTGSRVHDRDKKLLAAFIRYKNNEEWFEDYEAFFLFLLAELKKFEKHFGEFISNQQTNRYEREAQDLVSRLCSPNLLVSIDSFNYSVLENILRSQININGNYKKPIFGIDSKDSSPGDLSYIFTKTYRRMENDTDDREISKDNDFLNVVLYGHSLSSYDYSYFFPVMDKLRLNDFTATGKMVFAYSIYDKERENEIKTNYRLAIANLMEAYAKHKGLPNPNRLLDSLSAFRRVWIYEV